MAPGTNLGAASPVQIGVGSPVPEAPGASDKSKEAVSRDVHERKAFSDAAAYIRSLAQLRGRNAEWGEKAVLDAASLSATEAREQKVVDLTAADVPALLQQLEGARSTWRGRVHLRRRWSCGARIGTTAYFRDHDPTIALM
jgi:membrane-bound serine protease (ClpP class)